MICSSFPEGEGWRECLKQGFESKLNHLDSVHSLHSSPTRLKPRVVSSTHLFLTHELFLLLLRPDSDLASRGWDVRVCDHSCWTCSSPWPSVRRLWCEVSVLLTWRTCESYRRRSFRYLLCNPLPGFWQRNLSRGCGSGSGDAAGSVENLLKRRV